MISMTILCHGGAGGLYKQWTISINANKLWNDTSPMITNISFYFPANSSNCIFLIPLSHKANRN